MPFDWLKVAPPPSSDQLEVSVFGPGFGESIVCHFGNNEWLLVDSCVESGQKQPAALQYLAALGVDAASAVKLVVATHWDQDHIRGLGEVVRACSASDFCCAKAFVREEFQHYIEALSEGVQERGGKDIRQAFGAMTNTGRTCLQAAPGRVLLRRQLANGRTIDVFSLSPSDTEFDLFLQEIAELQPKKLERMRAAVARTPNLASVVTLLVLDDCAVLLGADMERRTQPDRGWNSVISQSKKLSLPRAALVKVPHHGSVNAHDDGMWAELLTPAPLAVIAPFSKGPAASRPPTRADIKRIKALSSAVFVTARHATSKPAPRSLAVNRSLRESGIATRSVGGPLGLVRLRKVSGANWVEETFGAALRA